MTTTARPPLERKELNRIRERERPSRRLRPWRMGCLQQTSIAVWPASQVSGSAAAHFSPTGTTLKAERYHVRPTYSSHDARASCTGSCWTASMTADERWLDALERGFEHFVEDPVRMGERLPGAGVGSPGPGRGAHLLGLSRPGSVNRRMDPQETT